jgi:Collagen triple helix repeat (20 copies)
MARQLLAERTIPGFSAEQSAALFRYLVANNDAVEELGNRDATTEIHTATISARANQFLRASPGPDGMGLLLPSPLRTLPGDRVTVSLEAPAGDLRVSCVPNQGADGLVTQGLVNGASRATFTQAGKIEFVSNGATAWTSATELPAESLAARTLVALGAAGVTGAAGAQGIQGQRGFPGDDGVGEEGPRGFPGQKGDPGPIGPQGFPGEQGEPGQDGFPGRNGADGATGATGATGAAGGAGSMAVVLVPDVAEEPGSFVPLGWGNALRSGPRTGGASAFVDVGDFINFGLDGPSASSPQIRSGDANFRIRGSAAASMGAVTGVSVFCTGVGAPAELGSDAGSVLLTTAAGTSRLAIDNTGAWSLAGVAGAAGQVPTSAGPGANMVWSTPSTGAAATRDPLLALLTAEPPAQEPTEPALQSWASCLARGPRSGAANPTIDAGQHLAFDTITSGVPGSGDIRKTGPLSLNSAGSITLLEVSSLNAVTVDSAGVIVSGDNAAGLVNVQSHGTVGTLISSNGSTGPGHLRLVEDSASQPTVPAGQGMYWVSNDTPSMPRFTDDTNVDFQLQNAMVAQTSAAAVSAAVTVLATTPTYTAAANTLPAGAVLYCSYSYLFTRGATATALTLASFFDVATHPSASIAGPTAAGTYLVRVEAMMTVLTTGGPGTAMGWISVRIGNSTGTTNLGAGNGSASFALTTTGAIAMRGACSMTPAVAATSITALGGYIQRVK